MQSFSSLPAISHQNQVPNPKKLKNMGNILGGQHHTQWEEGNVQGENYISVLLFNKQQEDLTHALSLTFIDPQFS